MQKRLKILEYLIDLAIIILFLNWGDFMKKQIMYLGYIIKEADGHIDIYKNKKYMSSIKSDWDNGVTAAKSKIDKVSGFRMR